MHPVSGIIISLKRLETVFCLKHYTCINLVFPLLLEIVLEVIVVAVVVVVEAVVNLVVVVVEVVVGSSILFNSNLITVAYCVRYRRTVGQGGTKVRQN